MSSDQRLIRLLQRPGSSATPQLEPCARRSALITRRRSSTTALYPAGHRGDADVCEQQQQCAVDRTWRQRAAANDGMGDGDRAQDGDGGSNPRWSNLSADQTMNGKVMNKSSGANGSSPSTKSVPIATYLASASPSAKATASSFLDIGHGSGGLLVQKKNQWRDDDDSHHVTLPPCPPVGREIASRNGTRCGNSQHADGCRDRGGDRDQSGKLQHVPGHTRSVAERR